MEQRQRGECSSFSFSFSFIFCVRSGIRGSDYKVLPQLCPLLTPPHSFTTQAVATTAARRCGVGVELPHIISAFLCKTITSGKLSNDPNRVCIQGIGKARTRY